MSWIFVGGSQRSGTSLLQRLLCQPPMTNPYVYECSYVNQLVTVYRDTSRAFSRNHQCYFDGEAGFRNFHSLLLRAFLEHAKKHLNATSHLVLKEPHLTQNWPFLYELIPDAIFLLIVRDPRDIVASMVTVGEKQKSLGQSYFFTRRNIPELCRHLLSFYLPALTVEDSEFQSRLAVVLYEQLVQHPVKSLEQISGFTGIDFLTHAEVASSPSTECVVDEDWNRRSSLYAPWVTDVSGQAVSESRVGNFRTILTESEIEEVETHCRCLFQWFGYETAQVGLNAGSEVLSHLTSEESQ